MQQLFLSQIMFFDTQMTICKNMRLNDYLSYNNFYLIIPNVHATYECTLKKKN